jgi:hypothetical protein
MIKSPLAKFFLGSLGYQTPGNKFRIEYLREFETKFIDSEKNQRPKISCYCPFKASFCFPEKQTVLKYCWKL